MKPVTLHVCQKVTEPWLPVGMFRVQVNGKNHKLTPYMKLHNTIFYNNSYKVTSRLLELHYSVESLSKPAKYKTK